MKEYAWKIIRRGHWNVWLGVDLRIWGASLVISAVGGFKLKAHFLCFWFQGGWYRFYE